MTYTEGKKSKKIKKNKRTKTKKQETRNETQRGRMKNNEDNEKKIRFGGHVKKQINRNCEIIQNNF